MKMSKRLRSRLIWIDRIVAWVLILVAAVAVFSGYGITKRLLAPSLMLDMHLWSVWFFIALLAFHIFVTSVVKPFPWRYSLRKIWRRQGDSRSWLRVLHRLSGLAVLATALLVIISGLDWYNFGFGEALPFHQHLRYDIYLAISAIVHVGISVKLALMKKPLLSKRIGAALANVSIVAIAIFALFLVTYADSPRASGGSGLPGEDTTPTELAQVGVGSEEFVFDPTQVDTARPDLFNPGYFSMFDVLVHLDRQSEIDLEYHFDDSMNTHVIDSINGEPYWWYAAYYDGGWSENNVFRMDHYPWKDGTTLKFFDVKRSHLEDIYSTFREEVTRRNDTGGRLVIPSIIIKGRTFTKEFENVEVTAHNLRGDTLREDVVTALDVILSLGDQGKIDHELQWYESIGTADIVKSYWVESIDGDNAHGRCGFVYEAGSLGFTGFAGNHIHLPTDVRILNSPEYVKFFWICI